MVPMAPSPTRTWLESRSRNSKARVIVSVAMGNARNSRRTRKLRYRLILAQSAKFSEMPMAGRAWQVGVASRDQRTSSFSRQIPGKLLS